ncbi:hypothetical protein ACFLSJ_08275 [Verrucomicrobiota bacterium]
MKTRLRHFWSLGILSLCLIACGLLFSGCEEADGTATLGVDPSTASLLADGDTETFTVGSGLRELSLPLEWQVTYPGRGRIIRTAGNSAVYERIASGANVIVVRDQYDAEGLATVNQGGAGGGSTGLTVAATPNPIPNGENTTTIQLLSGGTAPYVWSVGDTSRGQIISGQGTRTIQYRSSAQGSNSVRIRDASGLNGSITIRQD